MVATKSDRGSKPTKIILKKKPIKKDKPVKKGHEWQEMKKAPIVTKKPAKKKK